MNFLFKSGLEHTNCKSRTYVCVSMCLQLDQILPGFIAQWSTRSQVCFSLCNFHCEITNAFSGLFRHFLRRLTPKTAPRCHPRRRTIYFAKLLADKFSFETLEKKEKLDLAFNNVKPKERCFVLD